VFSETKKEISKRLLWACENPEDFVLRVNLLCRLKNRSTRVAWDSGKQLFVVQSPTLAPMYIARVNRIKEKYLDGRNRPKEIFDKYLLSQVSFSAGDVCIDVGANIGELAVHLVRNFQVKAICFEPDPVEFRCLQANLKGSDSILYNKALWIEETFLEFHLANDTGDSSLLPTRNELPTMQVETLTLKSVYEELSSEKNPLRIKLLKLEAEGAEPEILKGGLDMLPFIEYIAADLGPERGPERKHTICECVNLLTQRNFELVGVNPKTQVYLFHNNMSCLGVEKNVHN